MVAWAPMEAGFACWRSSFASEATSSVRRGLYRVEQRSEGQKQGLLSLFCRAELVFAEMGRAQGRGPPPYSSLVHHTFGC